VLPISFQSIGRAVPVSFRVSVESSRPNYNLKVPKIYFFWWVQRNYGLSLYWCRSWVDILKLYVLCKYKNTVSPSRLRVLSCIGWVMFCCSLKFHSSSCGITWNPKLILNQVVQDHRKWVLRFEWLPKVSWILSDWRDMVTFCWAMSTSIWLDVYFEYFVTCLTFSSPCKAG